MSDYDNTNRGGMFPTGNQELLRQGKVNFNGAELQLCIVKVITQSGKTVFKVYREIGAVFVNDKKGNEKAPDMSGKVEHNGADWKMAGWRKESQNGLPYTSISVEPPEGQQEQAPSAPEGGGDDIEDVPF
jgi:uncharacterized protein (DUF736 family)